MSGWVDVFWHEHPLLHESDVYYYLDICKECNENFGDSALPNRLYSYFSSEEMLIHRWHESCVPSSPNINHPCHPSHPLEILLRGPPNYADGKCSLCQRKLLNYVYHCKLCDFSVCMNCANHPPPLTVDHPKCHEHAVNLMVKFISFTCNTCGMYGEGNPYVCLPCSLMFHYDCVNRPHVININRHEHRVTHKSHLSLGNRVCGICRKDINWRYGAYSCNKCPDYFVHSKCATRKDVWDGIELEGIPEEEVDTAPFKVIDEGVINHFSHEEHNLFLIEDVIIDGSGEGILCEACAHPISFERYYKCMECDFMLHEDCANLPLQKRHALSTRVLSLSMGKDGISRCFKCVACKRLGSGFRYEDGKGIELDVHCASLSWFRHKKIHPHTLFLTTLEHGTCIACGKKDTYVIGCIECEYSTCFSCITLPVVIKHRCDDHYLFLSSGEKEATGKYWCEICEAEITDPEKWFYTCYDCGVICHIDCVVGDSLNIKPGLLRKEKGLEIKEFFNDHNTRPLCLICRSRCRFPMFCKVITEDPNGTTIIICSFACEGFNMQDMLLLGELPDS